VHSHQWPVLDRWMAVLVELVAEHADLVHALERQAAKNSGSLTHG
jgi:hypothetical protein